MPKAPRHRKRTRQVRLESSQAPIAHPASNGAGESEAEAAPANANGPAPTTVATNGDTKKVGKKEQEVTSLLEKLKSNEAEDRVWASSTLANLLLTLPPVTLRLLLSKNLIGALIERLADEEDQVVVESLGALRNLAVTSPLSLLLEMINKRLLPALSSHLTLLSSLLPSMLLSPPTPISAPLPSTASDRTSASSLNAKTEERRRLYWDWTENVLMLFWCACESNKKTLEKINADEEVRKSLVGLCLGLVEREALGLGSGGLGGANGMEVEGSGAKKSKKGGKKDGAATSNERVPLFVALTAAQTLSAFLSSNPIPHNLLIFSPTVPSLLSLLSTASLPPSLKPIKTDSHLTSTPTSDAEDFLLLRITIFGTLLEVSKNWVKGVSVGKKGKKGTGEKDEIMEGIKSCLKENSGVLLGLLGSDLGAVASAACEVAKDVPETPEPGTPSKAVAQLNSYEKTLSTLQHSLEILAEWCAVLDKESFGGSMRIAEEEDEDGEEWGGIGADDGMDISEDEEEDDDEEEGIVKKAVPGEEDDDEMDDEDGEERGEAQAIELTSSSLTLFQQLPSVLLKLAHPTPISFLPPQSSTVSQAVSLPSSLISTSTPSTSLTPTIPSAAIPIADLITTIHLRALATLNNLYITLARAISSSEENRETFAADNGQKKDLQAVWEGVLGLILGASQAQVQQEEEKELRMEVVVNGSGVVWGASRVGLGEGGDLIVGDATTPFLIELFSHAFAKEQTPDGESIRVRIAGSLGWIGRRQGVSPAENEMIGAFLLSILPDGKNVSPLAPTPEVLIQSIDSLIDLYSDEESPYDAAVFRQKGFLPRLDSSIAGVRAATKKIDRKKYPELRTRADGALENLVAFVEYRKDVVKP